MISCWATPSLEYCAFRWILWKSSAWSRQTRTRTQDARPALRYRSSPRAAPTSFTGRPTNTTAPSLGTANDWFNKRAELQAGLPNKPGQLIRNTFGVAVGGPIIKNRLFFFANYEGQRSREAVQVTQSVPSANLRQGIVSYVCNPTLDRRNCALGTPGVTSSSSPLSRRAICS